MPDRSEPLVTLANWKAKAWRELRKVWFDLSPGVEEKKPTFGERELTGKEAGYLFQRWVMEAFRLSRVAIDYPYKISMRASNHTLEEIDGLVHDGWQGFLIESKFLEEKVDIDPIFRLHAMVEQRPVGTIGLFYSVSGYTDPTLELVDRLRPIRVLLFDQVDLTWAMQAKGRGQAGVSMMEMVRRKWVLALRSGRPYIPVTQYTEAFGGSSAHAGS